MSESAEYVALVARLREKNNGDRAAMMLDLLERSYSDPAARLQALRDTLHSQGVSTDGPEPSTPDPTPAVASSEPAPVSPQRRSWRPAAAFRWQRRETGKVNPEQYGGGYTRVPNYATAKIRAAMPRPVLLAYVACCEVADLDGCFTMPAGTLAELIGKRGRKAAWRAMSPLVEAGLVRVVHEGGPGAATVYGLAPLSDIDADKVVQVFQQRAHQAREKGSELSKRRRHRDAVAVGTYVPRTAPSDSRAASQ